MILKEHMKGAVSLHGSNFQGSALCNQLSLQAQFIEFNQGTVYHLKVSQSSILTQYTRYLVIKSSLQLFEELTNNHQATINQEGQLVIPIQVQYRGRTEHLSIEVPLEKVKVENSTQMNLIILREMARMSRQSTQNDRFRQRVIRFKPDNSNATLKHFDLKDNSITKISGNNTHMIVNHCEPLPKTGIHFFQTKIHKTYSKNLIYGICTNQIKSLSNTYQSPQYLGLNLIERTILGNSRSDIAILPVEIIEKKSVVRVEVDMNKGVVSWFLDATFLCARKIPIQIASKQVLPMVSIFNSQDTLEFLFDN